MWISFTNTFPDIKDHKKLYFILAQQQSQLSKQDVTDKQGDEVKDK